MPDHLKSDRFELLRWPIDICAFGLGFGYGVTMLLSSASVGGAPNWSRLVAYAFTTFLSTLIVRRYMPSEERLEPCGTTAASLWINASLALSFAIPAIGIFYVGTPLFWIALLASTAIKAVHALESTRRKCAVAEEPLRLAMDTSCTRGFEGTRSGIERFMFEPQPTAYALRPMPTAFLVTGLFSSFAGAFLFGPSTGAVWTAVGTCFLCTYTIFSGVARGRALRCLDSAAAEPAVAADGAPPRS